MVETVLLWDFDGTLAYRNGMWRGALIDALDRVATGHGLSSADVRPGLRSGFPWHRPDLGHPEIRTADEWWDRLRPVFLAAYELAGVDPDVARMASTRVRECYTDPIRWAVFADSEPALAKVADHGFRQLIVSNHVPELSRLVSSLRLANYFDAVVTSAAVGWEKPHPRMFAAACAAAGFAARMWMIGDSERADIAGARAVGIPGILVRSETNGSCSPALVETISAVFDAASPGAR